MTKNKNIVHYSSSTPQLTSEKHINNNALTYIFENKGNKYEQKAINQFDGD